MIVVIPDTFGRHLNFNCHLHILVSEGGLREDGTQWCARARLDRKALMPMWRYAVIALLREAERAGRRPTVCWGIVVGSRQAVSHLHWLTCGRRPVDPGRRLGVTRVRGVPLAGKGLP